MSNERDYERELANAERDSREQYDRIVELEAEPIPGVTSQDNVRNAKRYMEKEMKL